MNFLYKCIDKIEEDGKLHFLTFFVVLVLLTLIMVYSYGLHPSHDFYFHFKRLNVLMEALQNGNFPVYIDHTAANGYGYITKWFYSDLMLVPFAYIGLATNAVYAYQFMWFSMTILCGIFMYYTVNRIYKNHYAASISSILFTFAVYRLLDVYTRSAVGEALSFTFLPLVFLGLHEIINGNYKKWYILAIGYSLMIFTHILSTFLMFITTVIILCIYYKPLIKEPKRILYLIIAGFATVIITAYFLFPMLEQMMSNSFYYQTVVKAHPDIHKHGIHWIIWGLFSGVVHPKQVFLPGLGILLTWAVSLRLFVKRKDDSAIKNVDIGILISIFYFILLSSLIPWTIFPFNKLLFIQLPWRLYEFISYFFAVAGGIYLSVILKSNIRRFMGSCILILCTIFVITSSGRDFQYEGNLKKRDIYEVATREAHDYHLYGMEYVPSKVPSMDFVEERGQRADTKYEETIISNLKKEYGITNFTIQTNKEEAVELPLFYYKGYVKAYDNDKFSRPVKESKHGLIEISANRPGNISVWYAGTWIQKISPFISITGLLLLCIYILIGKRKKYF